jgi:hypothetical protein
MFFLYCQSCLEPLHRLAIGYSRMPLVPIGQIVVLACALVGTAACSARTAPLDIGDLGDSGQPPTLKPKELDILVVVDTASSTSFLSHQASGVSALISELLHPSDESPVSAVRLGATFSFVRVSEILQEKLCHVYEGIDEDGGDLVASHGSRRYLELDADSDLSVVHSQIMNARVADCRLPAYLESARQALDGRNAAMIRSESLLVVLFITAAEDCSTKNGSYWRPNAWPPNVRGHVLCREPHAADLLYPIDQYVDQLSQVHKSGSTLFISVGSSGIFRAP